MTDEFADALVFGAKVALQNDPGSVTSPMPRTRHFGPTLRWDDWELVVSGFTGGPTVVASPTIPHKGEPIEQCKMMIVDQSGNLIEIKAYRLRNMGRYALVVGMVTIAGLVASLLVTFPVLRVDPSTVEVASPLPVGAPARHRQAHGFRDKRPPTDGDERNGVGRALPTHFWFDSKLTHR